MSKNNRSFVETIETFAITLFRVLRGRDNKTLTQKDSIDSIGRVYMRCFRQRGVFTPAVLPAGQKPMEQHKTSKSE